MKVALTTPAFSGMFSLPRTQWQWRPQATGAYACIAQGREGFLLTCCPLEGITLAPDLSPSWWTGSVVIHQGSSSFRVALASTGSQARRWRPSQHRHSQGCAGPMPRVGALWRIFYTQKKRYACILLLNRKTRIFWEDSCFPFSSQPWNARPLPSPQTSVGSLFHALSERSQHSTNLLA